MQKCTLGEFIATAALFTPLFLMMFWGLLKWL